MKPDPFLKNSILFVFCISFSDYLNRCVFDVYIHIASVTFQVSVRCLTFYNLYVFRLFPSHRSSVFPENV